jgi:hypothetical protein
MTVESGQSGHQNRSKALDQSGALTRRSFIGQALAAGAGATLLAGAEAASAQGAMCSPPAGLSRALHRRPSDLTLQLLTDPRLVSTIDGPSRIIAVRDEILVRKKAVALLGSELTSRATYYGSLNGGASVPAGDLPVPPVGVLSGLIAADEDTELWKLKPTSPPPHFSNSITLARYLNSRPQVTALNSMGVATRSGGTIHPPAVSPNHAFVTCASFSSCPGGPQVVWTGPPLTPPWIPSQQTIPGSKPAVRVALIDTGYYPVTDPQHTPLNSRLNLNPSHGGWATSANVLGGLWLDAGLPAPAVGTAGPWRRCPWADSPLTVRLKTYPYKNVLCGVAGHGTFIAGMIAHRSAHAQITIVGERRADVLLPSPPNGAQSATVWSDEFSTALALLRCSGSDIIHFGFAWPSDSGPPCGWTTSQPSLPISLILAQLATLNVDGVPAIVAPAGNEGLLAEYWPAAHPDVVGVAATNPAFSAPAVFTNGSGSNWGSWYDCCTNGVGIVSNYLKHSPIAVEDRPNVRQLFEGWASWEGTSFAAPQVTWALAEILAMNRTNPAVTTPLAPFDAFQTLLQHPNLVGATGPNTVVGGSSLPSLPGLRLPWP